MKRPPHMNKRFSNRLLARAKDLDRERQFYATGVGSKLAADKVIQSEENWQIGLPNIDEMILFLLFARRYYITDKEKQ